MALDRIQYTLLDRTNELDLLNNLHYVERLTIEANTNGIAITPTIQLGNVNAALPSQSSTQREFLEFEVGRIGPINRIEVSPFAGVDWFQVELYLRPVVFRIKEVQSGINSTFAGRANDVTTSLVFDVHPFSSPEDPRKIEPVIRRLFIDAETGSDSFTPVLTFDDGSTLNLAVVDTAGRAVTEYSIIQAKRVKTLTLQGNFLSSEIVLYSVEADLYVPNKRRMAIG